ncbi:MAG: hypothetical protein COA49_04990 [Bacteroidetes bacterium]|nr:MAG: hypothetical protein COA49_04990 [Bacteroidota bacterium]
MSKIIVKGNLRKMSTEPSDEVKGAISYFLETCNVLDKNDREPINNWVGKSFKWTFEGVVNCVVTGVEMERAYRMGMCKKAFFDSPLSCPSIINPELSTIHTGEVLRDRDFEERYHNVPHVVYLSRTDKLKVGVTGLGREQLRWNDQGAVEAIRLCVTPYRQLAGEIEVAMKEYINDKTYWLGMLKDVERNPEELIELKDECFDHLGPNYEPFFSDDDKVYSIYYPVSFYPSKIKSINLHKTPSGEGVIAGIKGQYLIFEDGRVLNIRAHEGSKVIFEVG